ncbi:A/G-specific adenine glycosylase [Hydrogenimonas sp.]
MHGRRELPWRNTRNLYEIYISEIMLQQTQVKTVLERFFFPFLKRFPTLQSVAEASLDDVLHAWQGLGYYRRARYIHRTAQIASPDLPSDPKELVKLPGIGKSTAHAIAVFGTQAPLAVLDANIKRVLHRFFAKEKATEKELWSLAESLLDRNEPYIYNQAMMDIGATLCLPKTTRCETCPLHSLCEGRKNPLLYPAPKSGKTKPLKRQVYLLVERESKILMRKRKGELLGGLWELPTRKTPPPSAEKLFEIGHEYTHFRRIAEIYRYDGRKEEEGEWIEREDLHEIALSSLEKKIFARLFEADTD